MRTNTSPVLRLIRRITENQRIVRLTDEELLRQFCAHQDEVAFRALVGRHGAMVFDLCRNLLGNEADAEDAFQATFLILARKGKTIRKQASVGSWLYGVAYRTACRARANFAKRQRLEPVTPDAALVSPADDLSWREVRGVLHEEITRVSDSLRAPLVLCYLEGKTQEQAAFQLGVSKETVKNRLERARALLRLRLTRRGLGPVAVVLAASLPLAKASAMPAAGSVSAMLKAVSLVAANQTVPADLISVKVAALSQGLLKAKFLNKLTTLAAGFIVASLLAVGAVIAGVNYMPETASTEEPPTAKNAQKIEAKPGANESTKQEPMDRTQAVLPAMVRQALEGNARGFAPIALTIEKQRSFPDSQSNGAKVFQAAFSGVLKPCTYEYRAQTGLCCRHCHGE